MLEQISGQATVQLCKCLYPRTFPTVQHLHRDWANGTSDQIPQYRPLQSSSANRTACASHVATDKSKQLITCENENVHYAEGLSV